MRIGLISNSDSIIPLVYTLAAQGLQVYLYYSPSADPYINQKVNGFVKQYSIQITEEKDASKDLYNWILTGKYDACFIEGYGQLIQLENLKNNTTPIFNIHFGSLPAYRGPVPIFWQLKDGVEKLSLVIHKLTSKFDDGPVVWSKDFDNKSYYNYQTVHQLSGQYCIEGVLYILQMLKKKITLIVLKQKTSPSVYKKRPRLEDILIDWQQMSASEICNLIRACNPWNKGAISFYQGKEIKLMDATTIDYEEKDGNKQPGEIVQTGNGLCLFTSDKKVLSINMIYYNDSFIPAYQCTDFGIKKGNTIGNN